MCVETHMRVIYLTNRSFNVAHNDDVSHVSPLESSSSVLLNQPVFVGGVGFLDPLDASFDEFLLLEDDDKLPVRRKPSMALPMMRASTMALRPSHFNRFSGDLCSFFLFTPVAFAFGFSFVGVSFDVDEVSVNLSNVSRANVTVACADDFTVFCLFDAGMCRFVNHPLPLAGDDLSSPVNCCLTPCKIDTSKLLERLDFLRLVLRSIRRKLLLLVADDDDGVDIFGGWVCIGVGTSLIRFISVAEEANDESKEIKSVLLQMMPAFLDGLGLGARDTLGESMLGFSDARRFCEFCGMGARVD